MRVAAAGVTRRDVLLRAGAAAAFAGLSQCVRGPSAGRMGTLLGPGRFINTDTGSEFPTYGKSPHDCHLIDEGRTPWRSRTAGA